MKDPAVTDVVAAIMAVVNDQVTPPQVVDWLNGLLLRLEDVGTPDPRFVKGSPIPTGVGAMADEYSLVREERLRIEKEAAEVKKRETELYNCIMSTLDESTDTGASGKLYRVQRIEKDRANVKEWPELWGYIQKNGAFDLLQKRLNEKAYMDQIEAGEAIPGVVVEPVPTLSFRKVD